MRILLRGQHGSLGTEEGKAAGRTVDQIVVSYSVPAEYSDFQADEASLRTTVQYVYDGQ